MTFPALHKKRPAQTPGSDFSQANTLYELLYLLEPSADRSRMVAPYHEFELGSAFQPIVSVSHGRIVGYEALMRGIDASAGPVSPMNILNYAYRIDEMMRADRLTQLLHFSNFKASDPGNCWLYLNIHPHVFGMDWDKDHFITDLPTHFKLPANRIVLEVLEQFILDEERLAESVAYYRSQGFLIAIDDFGSGHSNFDRVWNIKPDIVKLDRSLVRRSVTDPQVQRAVRHMTKMLHECGTIVLGEGVETHDEAMLLIEADIDLLQGFWLGRPEFSFPPASAPITEKVTRVWQDFAGVPQQKENQRIHATQPFRAAMVHSAACLRADEPIELGATPFLQLPGAHRFFILDELGFQRERSILVPSDANGDASKLNPLLQDQGACWSRRPYFWRAMGHPEEVQLTGPYFSLADGKDCYTLSVAVQRNGRTAVLCGDFFLEA